MSIAKKTGIIFFIVFLFSFSLFLTFSEPACANLIQTQEGFKTESNSIGEAFGASASGPRDIRLVIASFVRAFLGFLGIIFVVLIVYAGYLWMTAMGNADKVEQAKKTIIRATIGLVIILASYSITNFIIECGIVSTGATGWGCMF